MKYKNKVFEGATFPDAPIKRNMRIDFNNYMRTEYIPIIDSIEANKGVKLLAIIMANKEGFYKGTRSYRTNNPANIGNTDNGRNVGFKTLRLGIEAQIYYIQRVALGKHSSYPLGKDVYLKPYFSPEIAKNQKTYGIEPYVPGYKFKYIGELEQFVKIYSTGARSGNGYLSMIISFFENHGIHIDEKTTLAEIIEIK